MCSNISKQRILNSFKWYKNLLESCRKTWNSKGMGQTAESRKECMHKHKMVNDKNQQIRKKSCLGLQMTAKDKDRWEL